MPHEALQSVTSMNVISICLIVVVAVSVLQGMSRGASGSARQLGGMIAEGVMTAAAIYAGWTCAGLLSPAVQSWLVSLQVQIPREQLGMFEQLYYTLVTGVRDFPLLRFGLLFLLVYAVAKQLLYRLALPLLFGLWSGPIAPSVRRIGILSSLTGGAIGVVSGAARALILVAVLFVYATLFPQTPVTNYIQSSELYQRGAKEVIEPVTGDLIASKLPVFTRAVEQEFSGILQRKYEVIDAQIPGDIAGAAKEVTVSAKTDEEKAKLLYRFVGTRISYDWDKVKLYENQRIWKEQTPEDTFSTRKGVCIDFSRLYAMMARSVGLEVKVVTGLGYDGLGGYGPHAWNEVYLPEKKQWIPLDSTWVASGGNWFNPPDFDKTHIKEA
ncbi:transglutaminase domain-containing protein [Paenibacillus thalictri]|uniref:Transglutaminase domain-containing protein n=1 Tax=Paenibacillus thalictri TaxID=2527873 RepID=A0A4Q9DGZ1_9BACL|nr:transglutaminase domain-containing protein [Paenibacillus thalictri]TBL71549.1 transglutaminase domain-containing protein [Paenibacillus thalictri]